MAHPALYEINTRVWLRRFDRPGHAARLQDVPDAYWDYLRSMGITYVWLMGIWKTVDKAKVLRYALDSSLHNDYRTALADWTEADVIGSPYAIDRYEISPLLGSPEALAHVRSALHRRGMRLIVDFVPNHFHAETSLLEEQPHLFLQATPEQLRTDPVNYYRHNGQILAHGRDPYFPAWKDTVQVNYFDDRTRQYMQELLLSIAAVSDGIRCDMAMLVLNTVFESTWRYAPGFVDKTIEFWETAIAGVKAQYPEFQFIAEAYWDLEGQLQDLGFDYTYDKRLLDRLHEGHVHPIRRHLQAEPAFNDRLVRFLENHDEDRILKRMDTRRAEAAAVITYFQPGMRFFHAGQWEGRRLRLPVQLGRDPVEVPCSCAQAPYLPVPENGFVSPVCRCTYVFYQRLLAYLQQEIFQEGVCELLSLRPAKGNILAWYWRRQQQRIVIVVNYADHTSQAALRLPIDGADQVSITEPWRGIQYQVPVEQEQSLVMYPYEYRFLEFDVG